MKKQVNLSEYAEAARQVETDMENEALAFEEEDRIMTNDSELQKFVDAQDNGYDFGETYSTALEEMKKGYKDSCWMWYVFPQIQGLGKSGKNAYFSIKDLDEAKAYYDHPVLGKRLIEITRVILDIESDDPVNVFGDIDAFKLRSCMTLFKHAAPDNDLFQRVLDKYCQGEEDCRTLEIIENSEGKN